MGKCDMIGEIDRRYLMTRKDYEKIAEVLGEASPYTVRYVLVERFIQMLQADNPRFDSERFKAACKI